jgi:hypothetical protein
MSTSGSIKRRRLRLGSSGSICARAHAASGRWFLRGDRRSLSIRLFEMKQCGGHTLA